MRSNKRAVWDKGVSKIDSLVLLFSYYSSQRLYVFLYEGDKVDEGGLGELKKARGSSALAKFQHRATSKVSLG